MNYFELFGFKMAPVIDKTLVAKKYFELQKQFHPDFFSQSDDEEKEMALQQSAAINKAFRIFQHDDKTLEYFLKENAVVVTDEKYPLPPEFLMEMLDLNDAVTEESPTVVKNKISGIEAQLNEEVAVILNKDFDTGMSPAEMEALKLYYYKKKYLQRILDRMQG